MSSSIHPAVLMLVALVTQTGCTSLRLPGLSMGDQAGTQYRTAEPGVALSGSESAKAYLAVRQARQQNSIVLHLVDDSQPIRILPLPSEGQSVFVSTLLKQTGTLKTLGHIDVALYRSSADSIDGIRMAVKMEKNGKGVRPESDYALQPGDRIRVAKKETEALQNLVNMTLGLNY